MQVDANDPASLKSAIEGCDRGAQLHRAVLPFGPPILAAAIEAGIDYVDVCDDLDATERMLELDGRPGTPA